MKSTLLSSILIGFLTGLFISGSLNAKLVFETTRIEETLSPDTKSFDFLFPFRNEGEHPVQIIDVKTSCGCTVAKLDKRLYQPGETGQITGSFSVGGRQGKHSNTVRVMTDDLGQSEIPLGVEVTIPHWVRMKPGMLLWRVGDDLTPKIMSITPNKELGVVPVKAECDSDLFTVELIKPEKEEEPWKLQVTPVELTSEKRVLIRIHVAVKDKKEPMVFFAHIIVRDK